MKKNKIFYGFILLALLVVLGGLIINKNNKNKKEDSDKSYAVAANNSNNDDVNKNIDTEANKSEDKKTEKENELAKLENIKKDPFFILVNRENSLDESYEGSDVVQCEFPFISYITTTSLNKDAAAAAKKMFDAAAAEGINLLGASGYRTYAVQQSLYNGRVSSLGVSEADKYTARPGQSEHETGLALDILSEDYQEMDDNFDTTNSYNWLVNNCYKYGFILRYLKGKEDITGYGYEPWHYRYIGNTEVAKDIMDRGLTFEEYMSELDSKITSLQQ